jgi:hypothetical protein
MQQQWSGLGFSQSGTAGSISPELLLTASLADLSLENASLLAGQAYEAPHSQASLQLTTDPTGYLVDLGNGQLGLGSLQDLQVGCSPAEYDAVLHCAVRNVNHGREGWLAGTK